MSVNFTDIQISLIYLSQQFLRPDLLLQELRMEYPFSDLSATKVRPAIVVNILDITHSLNACFIVKAKINACSLSRWVGKFITMS